MITNHFGRLDNCYLDFEACQWNFWEYFNIPIPSPEILHYAISSSSFHHLHLDSLRSTNSKMQVINPTRSFFCGGRPWHLGLARVTLILTSKWSYLDKLGEKNLLCQTVSDGSMFLLLSGWVRFIISDQNDECNTSYLKPK